MSQADVTEEVRKTLAAIRSAGIKMAIGSSSKNTKFILKQVKLEDEFDAISDGTNISKSKPDPEVFLKAAEYLNLNPADCLVVEDAVAGIEAAKRAGMDAVGMGDAATYIKTDFRLLSFERLKDIVL